MGLPPGDGAESLAIALSFVSVLPQLLAWEQRKTWGLAEARHRPIDSEALLVGASEMLRFTNDQHSSVSIGG